MAIIRRGILGGFSGSVANVVGTSWKGIAVMKSKPLSVANPKTVGQVAQRTKFKGATLAGSKLLATICKPLWDREAQQMSGYNAFVKANIDAFSSVGVLDVTKFIPTLGKEDAIDISLFLHASGGVEASLSWDASALTGKQLASDEVQAVVFNETTGEFAIVETGITRADESIVGVFSVNLEVGDVVSGWVTARDSSHTVFFASGSDLSSTVQ